MTSVSNVRHAITSFTAVELMDRSTCPANQRQPLSYIFDGVILARRPHRAPQLSIDISCPQGAQNHKRDGIMGIKCIWSPSTFVTVIFFAGQCDELSASRDLLAEFNGEKGIGVRKGAQDNRKADRHPPHLRSPSTFQS